MFFVRLLGLFFALSSPLALAQSAPNPFSVGGYQKLLQEKSAPLNAILNSHLEGVLDAYGVANMALKSRGQRPLFCSPSGFAVNVANAKQMLDKILSDPGRPKHLDDLTPVSIPLLLQLQDSFPCQ